MSNKRTLFRLDTQWLSPTEYTESFPQNVWWQQVLIATRHNHNKGGVCFEAKGFLPRILTQEALWIIRDLGRRPATTLSVPLSGACGPVSVPHCMSALTHKALASAPHSTPSY